MIFTSFGDRAKVYAFVFCTIAVFIWRAYNGRLSDKDKKIKTLLFAILAFGIITVAGFDAWVTTSESGLGAAFLCFFMFAGLNFTYWFAEGMRIVHTHEEDTYLDEDDSRPEPAYNI
jgi:nitrate/nitrite transporter NarK